MTRTHRSRPLRKQGVGVALAVVSAVGSLHCSASGTVASPATTTLPDDAALPTPGSEAGADAAIRAASDADPSSDGGLTHSPACKAYCNTVMTNCASEYPQFGSMAACLNGCAFIPPGGASDSANDGNTIKCRHTHATSGVGHCLHGGPYGYGGCGFMCEGFCDIAMGWCAASTTGAPFASYAACKTECELWTWAPQGPDGAAAYRPTSPTTGDTLECREVMLVMSLASPAARDTYCPLAATNSATCK